jgi:hypothetical protein
MKKQKDSGTPKETVVPLAAQPKDDEKQSQPYIAMVHDLGAYVYLKSIKGVEIVIPWSVKFPGKAILKLPRNKLGAIRRCDVNKIRLEPYSKGREMEHTRKLIEEAKR